MKNIENFQKLPSNGPNPVSVTPDDFIFLSSFPARVTSSFLRCTQRDGRNFIYFIFIYKVQVTPCATVHQQVLFDPISFIT